MSERILEGIRLSSPDKILYPEQGITKGELADYYVAVADRMLPHVANRPVTMVRCPTGRQKKCFYQRHAGAGMPKQIHKMTMPGFDNPYLYIRDLPGLIAMAQIGVLELHPWGVRIERPDRPDRIIIDLDPDEKLGFADVARAAFDVRDRLAALGLVSFLKTTGGKGLHVVLPIDPVQDWPTVKGFAKSLAEGMAADAPDRYLSRISKSERAGRIFIDYLRNDPTSTAIAPYSPRSRHGAPVAFPLAWEELHPGLDPTAFNLRSVPELIAGWTADPWADIGTLSQALPDRIP